MRHREKKAVIIVASSIVYTAVLGIGLFAFKKPLFGVIFGDFKASIIQNAPIFQYEENMTEKDEDFEAQFGVQYGMLSSDASNLKAPLYYGDSSDIFENGAGTSTKYVLPGNKGTALIGAHDTSFFKELENVAVGDTIDIDTVYGKHSFVVTQTKVEKISDYKPDTQMEEAKIILYTCYPFGKVGADREERYYVYAKEQ